MFRSFNDHLQFTSSVELIPAMAYKSKRDTIQNSIHQFNYPVFAVYNSQGRRSRFRSLLISVLVCAAWSCDESKNWKQQAENSGNTPWNIIALCLISIETKTDRSAKYKPLECCLLISTVSCWLKRAPVYFYKMDNNLKFKTRHVSIVQRSSSVVSSFTS